MALVSNNDGAALTMRGCTVIGNVAANGGGVYTSYGLLSLMDSTVTANAAVVGHGGGTFNFATLVLNDSMVMATPPRPLAAAASRLPRSHSIIHCSLLDGPDATLSGFSQPRHGWTYSGWGLKKGCSACRAAVIVVPPSQWKGVFQLPITMGGEVGLKHSCNGKGPFDVSGVTCNP